MGRSKLNKMLTQSVPEIPLAMSDDYEDNLSSLELSQIEINPEVAKWSSNYCRFKLGEHVLIRASSFFPFIFSAKDVS